MDMAFDLENAPAGREGSSEAIPASTPRWPELRARLVAAREASLSLAKEFLPDFAIGRGSFDDCAAQAVSAYRLARRSVNPNSLGNRKRGERTIAHVAGSTTTGGRG